MRTLELLAPAKNTECGIAAIDHGADAVYIGASRFGARAAAGNTTTDIARLCRHAHLYGARVYVTVNTIIYEHELEATRQLITELEEAGVDALLIQDMGILRMGTRLPLHASTQCDTRTAEKVGWLKQLGFARAVLARELSAAEIRQIHASVPGMELEVFVHGALCVSYSGVCYASQYCFNRSANRGECAQFCRMKFDLLDADGREIEHQRHLLSLKDMCQIDNLEALADAGACSFKIEGRLKDVAYVKNVVAAYSRQLDRLIRKRPGEYCRASRGEVQYAFTPNLHKTFNRGFTTYFLNGRQPDIASFDTPKALGEFVGRVKELRGNSFNVAGTAAFANGDGLCFINTGHELEGFRVNRVEGNRLFPLKMPEHLRPGMALYRNNDVAFEKVLSGPTAERKLALDMTFAATAGGFRLQAATAGGASTAVATVEFEHQEARKPQRDNIVLQLTKLGNTPYTCRNVRIEGGAEGCFVPSSLLADLRRSVVEQLMAAAETVARSEKSAAPQAVVPQKEQLVWQPEYKTYPYLYNISNHLAREFYESRGMENVVEAFEVDARHARPVIMQCRHCIRYSLGYCVLKGGKKPTWKEPLYLRLGDGRRFMLEFRCNECQMNVLADASPHAK